MLLSQYDGQGSPGANPGYHPDRQYLCANETKFRQRVLEASKIKQETEARELTRKINRAKKRSAELDVLIQKLYESYAMGKLPETRFDKFLAPAKQYTDLTELTTPMGNESVDRILAHAPEKIDGERSMEIEIDLKFIGKFEIPVIKPTPEEFAAWDIWTKMDFCSLQVEQHEWLSHGIIRYLWMSLRRK